MREAYNAVFVESDAAGQLMFYGPGAGGAPTASAVVGDIVAVARNRMSGGHGPRESAYAELPVLSVDGSSTRYYIALDLTDKAGVLAVCRRGVRRARRQHRDPAPGGSRRRRQPRDRHP